MYHTRTLYSRSWTRSSLDIAMVNIESSLKILPQSHWTNWFHLCSSSSSNAKKHYSTCVCRTCSVQATAKLKKTRDKCTRPIFQVVINAGASDSRCHVWHVVLVNVLHHVSRSSTHWSTIKIDSDTDSDTSEGSSDNWILTYKRWWLTDTWLHTESVAHSLSFGHATQHAIKKRQQKNEKIIIVCFAYNVCCEVILL